jgi:hypothetical protein
MLTPGQQHHAMYHGGDVQKKAKAAMRRTATHLSAVQDELVRNRLGPVTPDQLATLASAAQIMRRLADHAEHAAEEADRIKARTDARRALATEAIKRAPLVTTADQVVFIALGTYAGELARLPYHCAKYGAAIELRDSIRQATHNLVMDAASSDRNPALFIDLKLATLPDLRQTHDALIRQIEQIVETQTAERESRQVAA